MLLAVVFGKFMCGKVCPLGWIQEWVHKIPLQWKVKTFKGEKILLWLKYVSFLFLVVIPFWEMKSGEKQSGFSILNIIAPAVILVMFIFIYRPFCKYICAYGAIASLFNLISPYRYRIDRHKCIDCGKCAKVCKMNLDVHKHSNHAECIRCGKCIKACPAKAIYAGFKCKGEVK
jgi:polyferredoxin